MGRKIIHGFLIGVICSAVAVSLYFCGLLNWIENPLWAWRVKYCAARSSSTDKIRVILIDQKSLTWGKQVNKWSWPWPRSVHSAVIDFCKRGGAKAVIFDFLFTEPSPWGVDDDERLGAAMRSMPGFATALSTGNSQGEFDRWPDGVPRMEISVTGLDTLAGAGDRLRVTKGDFPIPEIATNCRVFGNVLISAQEEGVIRRITPFHIFEGQFIPSLGLSAYLAANPEEKLRIKNNSLRIGNKQIPLDKDGQAILRFRGPSQTHPTVSAVAVIQSELRLRKGKEKPVLDPAYFKDCYVFYGSSATALVDIKATPVSNHYPGVEVNATFLDNLLANDFIRDSSVPITVLFVLLLALIAGMAGRLCDSGWQSAALFCVLLPLPLVPGLAAYLLGYWLPVAPQEVAVALSLVGAVLVNYALEGRQKRFIKHAFRQYLSPVIIERLLKHPDSLKLGGESRVLTIYFSDVKGFTSISENLSPDRLTALLNDYLSAMSNVVLSEGGTINKYVGDAIVAFWNAPLDQADHADRAVRAALKCQKKLAELRPIYREKYGHDVFCRIGLNTGPVVVGNMGSTHHFDYTFFGDAGNLASRLEGINKQFGTYILVSEFTLAQVGGEFACREISRVRVVGKKLPVRIFEPMWKEDAARRSAAIAAFSDALTLYYNGSFKQAADKFQGISPEDPVAAVYVKRCRELADHPPAQWDGIWDIKEK